MLQMIVLSHRFYKSLCIDWTEWPTQSWSASFWRIGDLQKNEPNGVITVIGSYGRFVTFNNQSSLISQLLKLIRTSTLQKKLNHHGIVTCFFFYSFIYEFDRWNISGGRPVGRRWLDHLHAKWSSEFHQIKAGRKVGSSSISDRDKRRPSYLNPAGIVPKVDGIHWNRLPMWLITDWFLVDINVAFINSLLHFQLVIVIS